MSEKTSPTLSSPITIHLWGTNDSQTFERVSDVIDWAERETSAWTSVEPPNQNLHRTWFKQRSSLESIKAIASDIGQSLGKPDEERNDQDRSRLNQHYAELHHFLDYFSSGQCISRAHPHFATIQALAETDANAGAMLLSACLNNAHEIVAHSGQLDALARIGATHVLDGARKKTIKALRDDLAALKKSGESDISTLRSIIDENDQNIKDNLREHKEAIQAREALWEGLIKKCDTDWAELKRVYDEKLALLAPTDYWRTRATSHRTKAIRFAIVFAVTLTIALWLFTYFGVSHWTAQSFIDTHRPLCA